jgi:Fur family ferric uptake transcriptional regulator
MRLLADAGFAVEHKFGENHTRYEVVEEGEHHDHLICVDCGHIVEFEEPEIESIQSRVASDLGFAVISHKHEVYVRCVGPCERRQAQPV